MAKRNPFEKYLKGEDLLQRAVMNYISMVYPDAIYTHPMNEGKRSPFEQYKMKYLGAKPGIPDLLIFTPNDKRSGLAIELKYKYNKATPNQKEWLKWLEKCNWAVYIHNDFDECINTINNYFKNEI
tara:strand:- start:3712 stop:4089 length:378 start_codon:yes stop_codon:yes gene_type:complete